MKVTVILPLLRLIRVDPPAAVVGEEEDDGVAVLVCLLQRPHHLTHRCLQLLQLGATILDQIAMLLSSCLRLKISKINSHEMSCCKRIFKICTQ
jgi:hypothetical protein